MELSFLYALQSIHSPALDSAVLLVTNTVGHLGELWAILGIILCFPKKTRVCGAAIIVSFVLVFLIGQLALKGLIMRPRPCDVDPSVVLLIERPLGSSFPSTHAGFSFAAAIAIICYYRKWGIAALVFAAIVAFTRMYLFVHYPTDVLVGCVLGIACGFAAVWIVNTVQKRREQKMRAA